MRKKKWAVPELLASSFYVKDPLIFNGNISLCFPKIQPIYLEVGCGKGTFISQLAYNNPQINYIAVDMISDMLGVARRNISAVYSEKPVDNLRIFACNVEMLEQYINEQVDKIYINFCNPWNKAKHHKHRLTHPRQLNKYLRILKKDGEIQFKTDDDTLFSNSVAYFNESGFSITYITHDLHNSDFIGNIQTEHEKMFSEQGIPIKLLIAKRGNNET